MTRLRMAVVGVGALGRHHARILAGLDSVDLVAVADTDAERGTAISQQHATRYVADSCELFDQIDAVSIAVPTTAHCAVAGDFLQRGIPVLVEKPLATDVSQAQYLVDLADRHETLLQVGHVERFNPATQTAWKHCSAPRYIRAERLSPYTFRSTDIGVVHDLMIHDIDLVLDLVGNAAIERVEAFGICIMGGHEDSVQARLTFENGCIADLTASRVNPTPRRSMHVWSQQGCVNVDLGTRAVVCYRPSETLLYGTPPVERAAQAGADLEALKKEVFETFIQVDRPPVPNDDALTAELSSFVDCVVNDRQPLVDGRQALRAMQVAEEVLERVAAHCWDGTLAGTIGPQVRTFPPLRRAAG